MLILLLKKEEINKKLKGEREIKRVKNCEVSCQRESRPGDGRGRTIPRQQTNNFSATFQRTSFCALLRPKVQERN